MKTVAYLRVSTRSQDLANQKLAILEFSQKRRFPIDQFIESRISSRQSPLERRIDEMLVPLEPGDRLLVSELSRLGRSLSQVIQIVETLVRRKIRFIAIKEVIAPDRAAPAGGDESAAGAAGSDPGGPGPGGAARTGSGWPGSGQRSAGIGSSFRGGVARRSGNWEKRSKREWSALYGRHQRQREHLAKDCRGALGRFRLWRELGGKVREIGGAIRGDKEVLGRFRAELEERLRWQRVSLGKEHSEAAPSCGAHPKAAHARLPTSATPDPSGGPDRCRREQSPLHLFVFLPDWHGRISHAASTRRVGSRC